MYYKNLQDFLSGTGHVINGKWYPRVTSIINIKSFNAAQEITNNSATEGTKVHNAIEAILKNEEPEKDPETLAAVKAFNDFSQLHAVKIDGGAVEKQIWSPKHGFAGTIDILGEVDGEFGVLDIKTSSGIWRDYNLQTAAYFGALLEDEPWGEVVKKEVRGRWILRIDQQRVCQLCGAKKRTKGGNIRVRGGVSSCYHEWSDLIGEWEFKKLENFESDYEAFLAAKRLWEWENEEWLKQIK